MLSLIISHIVESEPKINKLNMNPNSNFPIILAMTTALLKNAEAESYATLAWSK
jgi:hypothetical protein